MLLYSLLLPLFHLYLFISFGFQRLRKATANAFWFWKSIQVENKLCFYFLSFDYPTVTRISRKKKILLFLLSVLQTKEVRLFSWLTSFYLYFVFKTHRRIASTSFRFQQFWSKTLRCAALWLVDNLKLIKCKSLRLLTLQIIELKLLFPWQKITDCSLWFVIYLLWCCKELPLHVHYHFYLSKVPCFQMLLCSYWQTPDSYVAFTLTPVWDLVRR